MSCRERGFTFIDVLLTIAVAGVVAATSLPSLDTARRRYELRSATRVVAGQIRTARLRAVTTNRTYRVRFNCPVAGQFRVVEIVNNPAIDDAADRCSLATYPYPDPNPAVAPDLDGPVMVLRGGTTFGAVTDLDIDPTGRVTPTTGPLPATIGLSGDYETRNLTVSAGGRVHSP